MLLSSRLFICNPIKQRCVTLPPRPSFSMEDQLGIVNGKERGSYNVFSLSRDDKLPSSPLLLQVYDSTRKSLAYSRRDSLLQQQWSCKFVLPYLELHVLGSGWFSVLSQGYVTGGGCLQFEGAFMAFKRSVQRSLIVYIRAIPFSYSSAPSYSDTYSEFLSCV